MRSLTTSPLRIAGVIALVASLAGSAFAQGTDRSAAFPPGLAEARLIKEMPDKVGVGKETLEKLEKLVTEVKAKEAELQTETVEARNVVAGLLEKARPDEKEVMAAVAAASAVAREARELKVKTSLRIRALLTDEQLEKMMALRKTAMEKRRKGGRPNVRR